MMANEPMDEPIQAEGASELEVRPAQPGDRDAVLAFCAHTWSDGDYIEYVWDDWLADDRGVLLVGLLDGMRVDPQYRREGFGRILTSRTLVAARERGASVARLITSSDNLASQGMI